VVLIGTFSYRETQLVERHDGVLTALGHAPFSDEYHPREPRPSRAAVSGASAGGPPPATIPGTVCKHLACSSRWVVMDGFFSHESDRGLRVRGGPPGVAGRG